MRHYRLNSTHSLPFVILKLLRRLFQPTDLFEAQTREPLKLPLHFRPYCDKDHDSCIAVYRENELYFPRGDIAEFAKSLRTAQRNFIVATLDDKVVGFGGIDVWAPEVALFCWGMVSPRYQGRRIGTTLFLLRIAQLSCPPSGLYVVIFALDYSMRFYARFGFEEVAEWKSSDGCVYPVGLMHVSEASFQKLKAALTIRGIHLDGNLVLRPNPEITCDIEQSPSGRFSFSCKRVTKADP